MVRGVTRGGRGEAAEKRRRWEAVARPGAHAGHRGVMMVRREGPRVGVGRVRVRGSDTPRVLPRSAGEPPGVPAAAAAVAAESGRADGARGCGCGCGCEAKLHNNANKQAKSSQVKD